MTEPIGSTGDRPSVLLAFGPSASAWILPTFEPLAEHYRLEMLAPPGIRSPIARGVTTAGSLLSALPGPLAKVVSYGLDRLTNDWNRILRLDRYLPGWDIVHTVEISSGVSHQVARRKRSAGFCHVVTVWENIARRRHQHPHVQRVKRDVLSSADHLIAISERAKTALLLEGAEPEKISVAEPGVDLPQTPARREDEDPRRLRLLFVGKKLRSKGVQELLCALYLLLRDPDLAQHRVSLDFLGVEPSRRGYGRLITELGLGKVVREIPFVPYQQVASHYRQADALVVASRITSLWQEQWGMVFMEAMSHGLPIVTTHSGSISEVVGDAGLYARPNDHHSLYLSLKQLAMEPGLRTLLGRRGLARVARRFRSVDAAERIAGIYERTLSTMRS